MSRLFKRIDDKFQDSSLGKFFQLSDRGTSLSTEFKGALATFLSTAYILAVNPRILSDSGGPCRRSPGDSLFDPEFSECIEETKRQYVTSTAIVSCLACFAMGLLANLPIALAPGMGLNAYFTYAVVGFRGTRDISYEAALTGVMIEGILFVILAVTDIRYTIIKLIPEPVRFATPAAIGAFLAHIGLQTAEGIGLVVSDIATGVTLGACPVEKRTPLVAFTEACQANSTSCIPSDAYTCDNLGGVMTSATTWLGLAGLILITVLLSYKNKGAFVLGIVSVTMISWIRNTAVTFFPDDEIGDLRFEYFSQVVSVEPMNKLFGNFSSDLRGVGIALVSFLYVDFLDTSGTLLGLINTMGLQTEDGTFEKSRQAFAVDGAATVVGSFFGLSPVTCYIESGAGVAVGSRTGLTACFCGLFFFVSIFFAPIIASIPPWATGGALVVVGALMTRSLIEVKWHDPAHAVSAFLTFMIMPLTYSIAYGLVAGLGSWITLQSIFYVLELAGIERPSFDTENEEQRSNDQGTTTRDEEQAVVPSRAAPKRTLSKELPEQPSYSISSKETGTTESKSTGIH